MREGRNDCAGPRARRRSATRFCLVAILVTLLVSALPGNASAAPPWARQAVVPLVDCYAQNSDGSCTVILGYRSSYSSTRTISHGVDNYATPSTYTSQLPTVFAPGEQHGAAKVTISASDMNTGNPSWYLDGTTLNYYTASRTVGLCSSAQLPALANGGALVVLLLVAGAVGVLVVRRVRQRLTVEA